MGLSVHVEWIKSGFSKVRFQTRQTKVSEYGILGQPSEFDQEQNALFAIFGVHTNEVFFLMIFFTAQERDEKSLLPPKI